MGTIGDGLRLHGRGPVTLRHMHFRLTDLDGNVVRLHGRLCRSCLLDHVLKRMEPIEEAPEADSVQEGCRYLRVHRQGSVHGRLQGVSSQGAGVCVGHLGVHLQRRELCLGSCWSTTVLRP